MKPLAISEKALNVVHNEPIPKEFFINPSECKLNKLDVVETSGAIFVVTKDCSSDQRLLVIRRSDAGLFSGAPESERRQVYDRCARVSLRQFGEPVQLNPKWMPYHHGSIVSIFAYSDSDERIVFDSNPLGANDVYACDMSSSPNIKDLANIVIDYAPYSVARSEFSEACNKSSFDKVNEHGQIDLDDIRPGDFSKHLTYSQWYPRQLSDQQIHFVDQEITGPLRLRGAAGTGKTLAMVIKALKTAYDAHDAGTKCRILFTTHSWSAAEMVDQVMQRIDDRHIFSTDTGVTIDIFPVLTLAESSKDYSKIGRRPLGIDSADGKRRALDEISEVIEAFKNSDWIAYANGCAPSFTKRMNAAPSSREGRLFAWDTLIEFGCVLAAQGILGSSQDLQKYLRIRRLGWMMPLESKSEREVVFRLWGDYLRALKTKSLISSDQIVSDYLNELSTFYWEAARPINGYDVIFVDEMHLFNHQERLIFHNLLSDSDQAPRVVMALDPKQSPRETFAEVREEGGQDTANVYSQARLPNPIRIDLLNVYRYTPEIEQLIRDVNEYAPALDLPADWEMDPPKSNVESGELPVLLTVSNQRETFERATRLASSLAKEHARRKERVAILCLDEDRFSSYMLAFPQIENEAIAIRSRDDTEKLRFSGKKYVISAPEYVAGLQFSTVILVDVNKALVPDGNYSGLHLRRLLSEMYLGISRAEKGLFLIASRDAGGVSPVIQKSLEKGHIRAG